MIKLEDNTLSFKFPDIPQQLESLVEQHIQKILPTLALPSDRNELVEMLMQFIQFGERWRLREDEEYDPDGEGPEPQNSPSQEDSLAATAESLTPADLEAALRETANSNTRIYESMAELDISFQRTLRIPDDGKTYPLPAGAGQFPLCTIDDFPDTAPEEWLKRGGVMMPMYQSEALWIDFCAGYPFAVKVGAGRINAVSGEPWNSDFQQSPQNYVVVPDQPWLDGFSVGEGLIRQFVAMPLESGFSVEEQLTGKSEFGGIQLQVCPMRVEDYFQKTVLPSLPEELLELVPVLFKKHLVEPRVFRSAPQPAGSMGLAAGGTMRQEIYQDQNEFSDWDQTRSRRCFVHLCNFLVWRQITATNPPHPPVTAKEYSKAGIPWFDYYQDNLPALKGSKQLAEVKSVMTLGMENNTQPLPENTSITPTKIVQYGNARRPRKIREFLDDR